jgi:hypothetical protein
LRDYPIDGGSTAYKRICGLRDKPMKYLYKGLLNGSGFGVTMTSPVSGLTLNPAIRLEYQTPIRRPSASTM